jgi:hypothetical protein
MENKDKIKQILREGIAPDYQDVTTQAQPTVGEASGGNTHKDDASKGQYSRLRELLSNDIINHSGIIRRMKGWGDADDTERSLFKKKLDMSKNEQGGVYQFTKEEVEDIFNILMDVSKKMAIKKSK